MSFGATAGVFIALGAVLTLLILVLRLLKRFSPTFGGRSRLPMEVVQRLPLGPKHSIAVVRIGDRVLTVALGDAGVQQLGELEGADRAAALASSDTPTPFQSSSAAASGVIAALASNPELDRLPGGRALRTLLSRKTNGAAPDVAPNPTHQAQRTRAPQAAGADAFRSMLGMALSSATKLAIVGLTTAALLWAPATARAQVTPTQPPTTPPATTSTAPAIPPAQAPPLPPLPGRDPASAPSLTAPLSPAGQTAVVQNAAAADPKTAPARKGRDTQAPVGAAGTTHGKPIAPGSTAPSTVSNLDTMVAKLAPQLDLRMGGGAGDGMRLSGTVGVVIMMGLLTLLPTLVLMMTGFTRILIVLQFLKQALGTQSAPPNHLIAAMALILTGFVMGPTLTKVNETAVQPWLAGRMEQTEMMRVGVVPFRQFMLAQTRESDLKAFVDMSHPAVAPRSVDDVSLVVVMSAFVTGELRKAFTLGFALFLPFIVIDIVVSSVLMSMGMMMLPPAMIALPCKLLLFVLVDGWTLVMQTIVQSFGTV